MPGVDKTGITQHCPNCATLAKELVIAQQKITKLNAQWEWAIKRGDELLDELEESTDKSDELEERLEELTSQRDEAATIADNLYKRLSEAEKWGRIHSLHADSLASKLREAEELLRKVVNGPPCQLSSWANAQARR